MEVGNGYKLKGERERPSYWLNSRYSLSLLVGVTEIVSKIENVKRNCAKILGI